MSANLKRGCGILLIASVVLLSILALLPDADVDHDAGYTASELSIRETVDGSVTSTSYEKRSVDMGELLQKRIELSESEFDAYLETIKDSMYQYLLLIAASKSETVSDNGISIGDDTISVDLRSTLPSTFLRPHAQHGWTIKRKSPDNEHGLDMANNVVGILRIRVCDVFNWIGNGELLSQESLFPNPHFDQGYTDLRRP